MLHLYISVVPKSEDIEIMGLPSTIEDGTTIRITCVVPRIKPAPAAIYLHFNNQRYDGQVANTFAADEGTFKVIGIFALR